MAQETASHRQDPALPRTMDHTQVDSLVGPRPSLRRRLKIGLAALALSIAWLGLVVFTWRTIHSDHELFLGRIGPDIDAQHAFLHHRLHHGEALPMRTMLTHTFYGFSLVDSVLLTPDDTERRTRAVAELRWILERLDDPALRARYADTQVKNGVYYLGERNLTLAGLLLIDPDPTEHHVREFHSTSRLLFDALVASPIAHLDSYPEHVWPVDNIVALYSLAVHDRLYGTSYRTAVERWVELISRHLDPETGLMPTKLDPRTGAATVGPRGVTLAFSIAFLSDLVPELATAQYGLFRQHHHEWHLGVLGIREYRRGVKGPVDVDSGPIAFGIGAGASGFALAAARAMEDEQPYASLLLSSELLGAPFRWRGRKRYLLGTTPIVDAVIVWGKTRTSWLAPEPRGGSLDPTTADSRFSRTPLLVLLALAAGALFVPTFRLGRRVFLSSAQAQ